MDPIFETQDKPILSINTTEIKLSTNTIETTFDKKYPHLVMPLSRLNAK